MSTFEDFMIDEAVKKDSDAAKLRIENRNLRTTLRELERAVSAFHAHDFHPAVAPQFRDMHAQVTCARELLGI